METITFSARVGSLVVQHRSVQDSRKHTEQWVCKCDCGNKVTCTTAALLRRKHHDCGCGIYYVRQWSINRQPGPWAVAKWKAMKKRAEATGRPFYITQVQVDLALQRPCSVCKDPTIGLRCTDLTKGYTNSTVIPVCEKHLRAALPAAKEPEPVITYTQEKRDTTFEDEYGEYDVKVTSNPGEEQEYD